MIKIRKSSELLWVFGIIFVALGVCICSKADLGVSMIAAPAFVIYEAIAPFSSILSIGMVEYIIQGILLIIACIIIRKFRFNFLLSFLVAFIYGLVLDLFLFLFSGVEFNEVYLKWIMLLVGDIITAFGVACFFRTYLPLQVYEFFVSKVSSTFKISITTIKWCFDISLLILSIIFAFTLFGDVLTFDWSSIYYSSFHSIGLGTCLTTIINSPIIKLMGKFIDKVFDNTPLIMPLSNYFDKKNN